MRRLRRLRVRRLGVRRLGVRLLVIVIVARLPRMSRLHSRLGLLPVGRRFNLKTSLFLHKLINAVTNIRQLRKPIARGEDHAGGYKKRRKQRRRAECFFH